MILSLSRCFHENDTGSLALFFLPFTLFSAEPNFEEVCHLQVTPLQVQNTFNIQPCGFKATFTDEEFNALSVSWVVTRTDSKTPTYDLIPTPNNPLYDEALHSPDENRGCEFIGDYKRTIIQASALTTRCGGGAPEVIFCRATISCRSGSALHQKFNLENEDFEGEVTCLAKDRQCPSLSECASDEEYKMYQGEANTVIDELQDQSTATQR